MHRRFVTYFATSPFTISPCWERFILQTRILFVVLSWMLVKKYRKCSFWKLNNCFWRCNRVLSRRPCCTCTKPDTGLRTYRLLNCVNTTERRMQNLKYWSSCFIHGIRDCLPCILPLWLTIILYKPLVNFSHFLPCQYSHVLYEHNFSINNMFWNVFLKYYWLMKSPYPKLWEFQKRCRSINLNFSDHVRVLCVVGKIEINMIK